MLSGRCVHCHFDFSSPASGVGRGVSGNLAKRVVLVRGGRGAVREVPMEHRDSWGRPMPLAAPMLADTDADAPAAYYDGIRAILEIAVRFDGMAWNAPTTCPEWRA